MTTELRTVYVEWTTAAALAAEARRAGRPLADLYREHLSEPAYAFNVRVVNIGDKLRELLEQGLPWFEALQRGILGGVDG